MRSFFTDHLLMASDAINYAEKHLCPKEVEKCLHSIDECYKRKSKIIFSGVGKSGIVSRKLSATFSSIGIMALYINPLDAMHGDMGVIKKRDICIFLSNSGETKEIVDIIHSIKKKNVEIITIVGDKNSSIAKLSDVILFAKVKKEICPLNIAPTASTTVAMAIGDAMATTWMKKQNISMEDFALNHPAGSIGRKLALRVSDLMIKIENLDTLSSKDPLINVIRTITKNSVGSGLVLDFNKELIGIITDGDLRRGLEDINLKNLDEITAETLMTRDPIIINSDELAVNALEIMQKDKFISVIPVFCQKQSKIIGIIRIHDILQAGFKDLLN